MISAETTRVARDRYRLAALLFEARLALTHRLLTKYAEDQPRVPAGSPDGGQWAGAAGAGSALVDALGELVSKLPTLLLAGGFGPEDMGKTVQDFASSNCEGRIFRELPGQFLDMNIFDVLAQAKAGDKMAKKCKKILEQDRFRK